jgi:hypothetical protein
MNKILCFAAGAVATSCFACSLFAQGQGQTDHPKLNGYHVTIPWSDTAAANAAGHGKPGGGGGGGGNPSTGIPTSPYSVAASKDGNTYTGTLVGTTPLTPATNVISTVIVPLSITIGGVVFDPTQTNGCADSSALNRLLNSPLVVTSPLSFNNLSVGTTQYVDGFRKAEFGSTVSSNTLSVKTGPTLSLSAGRSGTLYSSGCTQLGIVSNSWITNEINTLLATIAGVTPSTFVIFLTDNVVQSTTNPPSVNNCCILGFHSALGNPAITYAIAEWDTTGDFGANIADASIATHEIAEWMDDPFGNNPTPAWGGIGQVSSCQNNYEVGDPLSGTLAPTINLNGFDYHMQELAYFSWFFNSAGTGSLGAGGNFSSNGTFKGPSKACPPGGTN